MNAPPVVSKHVEDTQNDDKEGGRPLCLEANGNHDTSGKTNNGDKETHKGPFSLNNEAEEKEDEKNATSKEEAVSRSVTHSHSSNIRRTISCGRSR